jgi:broad specificity phosphatase PhoE
VSTAGNTPPPGKPKLHRGVKDLPPTPEGIRESEKLARQFVKMYPDIVAIYSSPLERTKAMADELAAAYKKASGKSIEVEITPAIQTWNTGKLAGRPMDDVRPILKAYSSTKRDAKYPGMVETFEDFLGRWLAFLSEKLDHDKTGVIVICTQGTNIGTALQWDHAGRKPDYAKLPFKYERVETVKPAHWLVMKEESGHTAVRSPEGKVVSTVGIVS